MSFHIEWERLACQAYDMLGKDAQAAIAMALVRMSRYGIPDDAEPDEEGRWLLRAGGHVIVFTENDCDLYLIEIEQA